MKERGSEEGRGIDEHGMDGGSNDKDVFFFSSRRRHTR